MYVVDNVLVGNEITTVLFTCDLARCKGACCASGDSGTPLEMGEVEQIEHAFESVKPYLTKTGYQQIEREGLVLQDNTGQWVLPTVNQKECAYAVRDDTGVLQCAFELAFIAGKTRFQKPIYCHLYPLQIHRFDSYETLHYHRWYICASGCTFGKILGKPLYEFVKPALIRQYGQAWYDDLVNQIQNPAQ